MAAKPLPSPPMGTSAKPGGGQPRRLDTQLCGRGPPNIGVLCFTRYPRSARSGSVVSAHASGSVFRVLRVPERSGALSAFCAFS